MKELGDVLKKARLEKDMSLEEVSSITKISVRYLNGIENGDLSMMPGSFYIRGFIRSYAKVLNIDISQYLDKLDISNKDEQTKIPTNIKTTTSKPVKARKFGKLFSLSLVLILILVIFSTIIYFSPNNDNEDTIDNNISNNNNEPSEMEPLPEKETPDIKEEIIIDTKDTKIELVEEQANVDIYAISNLTDYKLKFVADRGTCWFEVRRKDEQGEIILTNTLRTNDAQEISITDNVWIRLGNPDAIDIFIEDKLIDKKLTYAKPRNFIIEIIK